MSIRPESLKALQDVPRLISVLIYLVFYSSESLRHRDLIRNVTLTLANLSADPQLHPIMLKEINRLSDDRFARVFELRDIPSVESFILFLANLSSSKNTHHALASPTVLRKVTPYLDIEKMIRIKEMHHNHFREKVREERRKEDEQLESAELARKEEHNKAMALRKAKQELELATSNQLERDILDVTLEKSSPGERDALKKAFEEKQSLRQLELKKEAKAELAEEQRREAARLDAADARRKARQEADEEDQRAFEKELHDSILIQRRITHLCLLFLYNVCSSHRTRELVAKESLFVICFLLQALDGHDLVLAAELLNEISSLESVKVRLFTEPEMHTFVSTFKSLLRSDLVDVRGHALTAIARSCTAQTVHHNLVQSDVLDLLLQGLYSKIKEIQLTSLHALCFLSANPDEQVSLMLQKKRICETYLSHITSNSVFTECRQLAYIILGQLAQHREFHVDFARKMPVAFLHIEEDTKENLLDCIVTILENHGRRRKRYKPKGEAIVNVEGDDAYMHRLASPRKSVLTEYLESFQICNGISFATRTELLRNIEQKKDSTMTEIDGAPATLREGAKNEKEITINDSNRSTSQTKDIRLTNAKELECALFAVMNLCMHRYLHHLIVERCGPLLIRLTLDWFEHSDATFRRVLTMLLRNISSTNEGYPAFRDFKPSLLPLFQLAEVEMRIETMNNILCCFRNIAMHELSSRSVARSKAVTTIITHILIKYSNIEDEVGSAHKLWKKVEALKNTADHCSSRAMIAQKRREVFSLAVEDAETNVQYEEANRQELFKRILHQKLVLKSILKRETIHLLYHASLFRHSLALITYNTHFLSLAAQLLPLYRTSPEASRKGAWILANIGTNLETRELAIKHSVLQM